MLRAVGMRRSHLVRSFIIEGTIYATLASLAGVVVGIGMGRAVVVVAARIYSNFQAYTALHMVFHVTGISLINGLALGLLMALLTVAMTSLRISRINIIAAIRDLPSEEGRRMKLRWVIAATATAVLAAVLAVPAIASNEPNGTYVLPAIAAACLVPLLLRVAPKRLVYSGVALAIILWTLVANTVRPHLLLTSSTAVFIEIGLLLTFAGVVLLSENQELVTAPLRPLIDRASQLGLSTRLAVAYPLGKRFRTGAILIMFGLVVFTLVFITTLTSLIQGTVNRAAVSASGGFAVRADVNVTAPSDNPARSLISGGFGGKIEATAPLLAARATATDLAPQVTEPVDAVVVGFDQSMLASGGFRLIKRAPIFGTDAAAWDAVAADPRYAIVDNFIGQLNSDHPPQDFLRPGQVFTLTDPLSGRSEQKILAGTLDSSYALYGMGGGLYSPVLVNRAAAREQFGDAARPTSVLLRPAPGVAASSLASELQGTFLEQGLVATRIRHVVEESYASSNSFFQLMQGFIALGLLVGIAGLAVVMIRAVRERRRSIGVLRALGFQARTVQRAFLTESLFVTLEGVLLGTVLALITTYMLFKNYELFQTAGGGFSIPWLTIAIMGVAATIASVLATVWPARQASRIRPAVAIRIAD
jgi:putative ABC transport system permease protein